MSCTGMSFCRLFVDDLSQQSVLDFVYAKVRKIKVTEVRVIRKLGFNSVYMLIEVHFIDQLTLTRLV